MIQTIGEASELKQVTLFDSVTAYYNQGTDIADVVADGLWSLVASFSFQGQVLLVLVCWLVINLIAIQISWKVFGTSLFNPKIPG